MMNALVKEAKDTVLEELLRGMNEEPNEEEEEEIARLAQDELNAANDPDLKETKAKPKSKKPAGKSNPKSKDKAKSKSESVVDKEGINNLKVPAKNGGNAAASSSKASTKKTASAGASSSKASNIIDAPINVDSEGDDSDTPLVKKSAARRIIVDSEGEEDATIGKGKQPAGSKGSSKRKAPDVVSDEGEASTEVQAKEVESTGPPPSKKAKRADTKKPKAEKSSTSRMMREGPQWQAKKRADAAAVVAAVIAASSLGTTIAPPTPAPLPPGTSFFLFFIPNV